MGPRGERGTESASFYESNKQVPTKQNGLEKERETERGREGGREKY